MWFGTRYVRGSSCTVGEPVTVQLLNFVVIQKWVDPVWNRMHAGEGWGHARYIDARSAIAIGKSSIVDG